MEEIIVKKIKPRAKKKKTKFVDLKSEGFFNTNKTETMEDKADPQAEQLAQELVVLKVKPEVCNIILQMLGQAAHGQVRHIIEDLETQIRSQANDPNNSISVA